MLLWYWTRRYQWIFFIIIITVTFCVIAVLCLCFHSSGSNSNSMIYKQCCSHYEHRNIFFILLISVFYLYLSLCFFPLIFLRFYIRNSFEWKQYYTLLIRFHGLRLDLTFFYWRAGNEDDCCHLMKYAHAFKVHFKNKNKTKNLVMKHKWKVTQAGRIEKYSTSRIPYTGYQVPDGSRNL